MEEAGGAENIYIGSIIMRVTKTWEQSGLGEVHDLYFV